MIIPSMTHVLSLLPADTTITSYGTPHADEIRRDTAVAVIYDPKNNKYLCQFWQEYSGLTCLLSGGLEEGETFEDAIIREVEEETGYTDFELVGQLGAELQSHYTKNTGEHFVKHITPFLIKLNSHAQKPANKEDDEKFENLLLDSNQILEKMSMYEATSGSTLEDHKEILLRGIRCIDAHYSNR